MKLTTCLMIFACLQVGARGVAQKVSLDENKTSLEKVLQKIGHQTGYTFLYESKVLEKASPVTLKVSEVSLNEALNLCLKGQPLTYKIFERTIVIKEKLIQYTLNKEKVEEEISTPLANIVKGKVTNSKNEPLVGVSVVVKGAATGTSTDGSGNYSIDVPADGILVFSYVGYATREIKVNGRSSVNVMLEENVSELNQVVVVGYGTQMKRDVTGAISSIKGTDLIKSTASSFTQALHGDVPGLTAIQTTGQAGANVDIKIRSNPSFASSGVLYVLDGVPVNGGAGDPGTFNRFTDGGVDRSPLNFINPNDIESIEVLKDASAASIYGARAGAGVVLITTKRGKSGRPVLNYGINYSVQSPAKFYDFLNTKDYMIEENKFLKEIWLQANGISPYGDTDPNSITAFEPRFTDEQISSTPQYESTAKLITRGGFVDQHNLALSGGNSGTKYYISGNYFKQKGVIVTDDYTRFNGRINLDQTISKSIRVGVNMVATSSDANNASIGIGTGENSGLIATAMIYPPDQPLIDPDGNYLLNSLYAKAANPAAFLKVTDKTTFKRLLADFSGQWSILDGLVFRARFSNDYSSSKRSTYQPSFFVANGAFLDGNASIRQNESTIRDIEYTLNYDNNFNNDQSLKLLLGYTYQKSTNEGLGEGNYGFITDQFLYNNIGVGTQPRPVVSSSKQEQVWASYFFRAIYQLKNKYLLQTSVRRDGASNFAKNKKYGIFPSASAGWIASEERFFKDNISFFNYLKLRLGYGTTGNSNVGNDAFAYYSTGNNYVFGNSIFPGVYLSQLQNDRLTWETAREINIGLDFQVVNNRVSGSFDYFNKTISNLLSNRPLPADFPVSSIADNIGKTRSRGWEVGLKTMNILSKSENGFEWKTGLTFSHYYDFWVQHSEADLSTLPRYVDPHGPFNPIYGYLNEGIYKGGTSIPWMPGIIPGVLIVKDLDGYDTEGNLIGKPDGKISSADETLLGLNDPKYSFGINNTFNYHNISLTITMYGLIQKKFNNDWERTFNGELLREFVTRAKNQIDAIKDRWSSTNLNGIYPSGLVSSYTSYGGNSDFWIENGNFLRCQDITLGYSFPSKVLGVQKLLSSLNLSLSLQNAFIITKYRGLDPELQNFYAYPNPKSVVVSLNASF